MLSEAILLERGRRRAAAAALSGTRTPVPDPASSTPSIAATSGAAPNPKELEERLAAAGTRARGARYKSSPLVAGEKPPAPAGTLQAQAQALGLPPTVERKES